MVFILLSETLKFLFIFHFLPKCNFLLFEGNIIVMLRTLKDQLQTLSLSFDSIYIFQEHINGKYFKILLSHIVTHVSVFFFSVIKFYFRM